MLYIIISILSLSGIFVIFKLSEKYNQSIINILVVNYFVASVIGYTESAKLPTEMVGQNWLIMALIIGVFYFAFFVVTGWSTALVGLSVTTVAAKMSVVIPMLFSIIYYNESVVLLKILGILAAILGVLLTVYKKENNSETKISLKEIFVPVLLFAGMGMSDSMVKYTQNAYLNKDNMALFSASLFFISFVSSIIYAIVKKEISKIFKPKVLLLGVSLGLLNYYGVLSFIKAFASKVFDSSVIFGITNVGIVSLSVLIGVIIFKEKLTLINKMGVILSVLAIVLLSQS